MTRDEIVTALRCCTDIDGEFECSTTCPFFKTRDELGDCCTKKNVAAADLIENQQRHIEALMKANDSLKDAIARRDKQIAVRCRECKHCDPENYHCDHPMGTAAPLRRKPDDFCSYGEREEGADNG